MLFEENNEDNHSNGGDNWTDNHKTPNDWAGKEKEDLTSIPKYRFDEVNEKRKQAEAELQKYKEAEAKKLEEESLKKWEYEKIISQKDQEIAEFKKQQEAWKVREEAVSKRNLERIEAVSKKFGDNWDWVKNLIEWFDDPFILSDKISSLETMINQKAIQQTGWSHIPSWWNVSRKQELMEKLKETGTLTAKEQKELLSLTDK